MRLLYKRKIRIFYKRKKQKQKVQIQSHNTSENKNKWIVLLTMAVNVNGENEHRKKLYKEQLLKWLNYTDYYIYVIESTGVHLDITHERLKFISFELFPKLASSSQSEATSILHILNNIINDPVYIDCTHILKVTGRYFLHNINGVLNNCVPDLDVYIQHHYNIKIKWQHTEYFGVRKTLLEKFLLTVVNEGIMEHRFYEFIVKNKLKFRRIGPFVNNVARGGDKMLINPL
jgi:hypothetical protein